MKNFVLAILLLLCHSAFSQTENPKKIATAALQKLTGGKELKTFKLAFTYDTPREIPVQFRQTDAFEALLDSLIPTLPDSMQRAMQMQMDSIQKESYLDRITMYAGWREEMVVDLTNRKSVTVITHPNSLTGSTDTSRNVYDGSADISSSRTFFRLNPVTMLQYMVSDSAELHYTGSAAEQGQESHIIQVRTGGKWIEVYIGKNDLLIHQLIIPQVDTDPLIGQGPQHYRDIIIYSDYRKKAGFLLPDSEEDISSRGDLTIRKRLVWENINKPVDQKVFKPEPEYEDRFSFKIHRLSDSVFVLVKSGPGSKTRSLIHLVSEQRMDIFMEPVNHEKIAARMLVTISNEFPNRKVHHLYSTAPITYVSALEGFFKLEGKVFSPKGYGFNSEEKIATFNSAEDSVWQAKKTAGTISVFNNDLREVGMQAFILNPKVENEWHQLNVCYYLPKEKLVFYEANPYQASRPDQVSKREKDLYDFLIARHIAVNSVVFSEAWVAGSPLEMTFAELARRIKNTDFGKKY